MLKGIKLELSSEKLGIEKDLFRSQFPGGLPFGNLKPDFAVTAEHGGQALKFELKHGIGGCLKACILLMISNHSKQLWASPQIPMLL
ncbi:MAG: hypothetical protein U0X75_20285 [Acidobacteriota bacterium]